MSACRRHGPTVPLAHASRSLKGDRGFLLAAARQEAHVHDPSQVTQAVTKSYYTIIQESRVHMDIRAWLSIDLQAGVLAGRGFRAVGSAALATGLVPKALRESRSGSGRCLDSGFNDAHAATSK
jgi:hypothetical protein